MRFPVLLEWCPWLNNNLTAVQSSAAGQCEENNTHTVLHNSTDVLQAFHANILGLHIILTELKAIFPQRSMW